GRAGALPAFFGSATGSGRPTIRLGSKSYPHSDRSMRTHVGGNSVPMKWLLDILKGTWLEHPLHPILAHVPMAMWPSALIFDLLSQRQIGGNAMVRLSFYAIIFGLAAALLAVPTGLVDWSGIKREKPAWKIGLYHMSLNLIATLLFAVNLALR